MQQKILSFQVTEQFIRAPRYAVVGDSRSYLVAHFSFSEHWQGLTKTAVFQGADGKVYHMLLDGDSCVVPAEVIKPTRFVVSVFGGDRLTTDRAAVEVRASGFAAGVTPPTPTPDIYDQLVSAVETERQLAEAAAITAGEKAEVCATAAVTAAVAADDAAARANEASFYADQCSENAAAAENAAQALEKAGEAAENFMEQLPELAAGKNCYRIIEQNKQVPTALWVGTVAEYAALTEQPENTVVIKTDDDTAERRLTAAEQGLSEAQADITALEKDVSTVQEALSAAESAITVLQADADTAKEQLSADRSDITAAQESITAAQQEIDALQALTSSCAFIADGSQDGSSLMDWCDAHLKTGIQTVQLGSGVTDAPTTWCNAFFACNAVLDRRTIWIIGYDGTIYTRAYLNGEWKSWYSHAGTAVTV